MIACIAYKDERMRKLLLVMKAFSGRLIVLSDIILSFSWNKRVLGPSSQGEQQPL